MSLYVQETYENATEEYRFGESDVYETWTDEPGKLYRDCVKEYGRCVGKVYIDRDGKSLPVGWVFEGRQRYEDTNEVYLRRVWVTLHDAPDTVTREHHYHILKRGKL